MAETKLVTILFCDLVGSTALMTRLGDDANDRVRRRFFVALREAVVANRGEEVKSAGDGMMVAFPGRAVDAVSCAVAMQRAVSRLDASDPLLGLAIRVGLSSGEASFENNDWFGVTVVEAARLEHAARPGQILCSELTRGLVGTRGGHAFTPVGALELKGLPEPLPACEVAWEPDPGLPAIPLPSGLVVGGLPFAGRAAELATLHRAWDDAIAGERRFVLVTGEQGIGKTRLAAQFASSVHGDNVVVLYGRSETDREVPYQPFAEALRWYVLAGQPASLREQVGAAGGELTRIVPALRLRLPDLPEPRAGDPATEREALFDSVLHTLCAVSERAPVLLLVDDLEQAEEPTLALLRHVVTSPERFRLLVLGLAGEASEGSPWAAAAAALAAILGCVSIPLAGLETADIASLLERVEGAPPDPGLAERIRRETDGSPRFIAELIARLHESGGGPDAVIESACPYMGLRAFDAGDAALYFGRDELIGALLGRLGANRLLSVVGASGSGKSSLVRAGLVPRLRDGALPGSRDWEVLVITPGAHPLAELAAALGASSGLLAPAVLRELEADPRSLDLLIRQALASRPANAHLVLVVDQFEELFTLCRDEVERRRFIDALLAAVGVPGGRTMAILAMRADFYGEAARYPGLAEALEVSHALLGPMSEADLRSAIEQPAAVTGLRIEPGLADRILRDVGDEPGGLPLLSHALLETWKRRDGRTLTLRGYEASGGVRGAITQTAEAVYGALEEAEQGIARDLFVRLTELGEGTEDTRRRVAFSEVTPDGPAGEAVHAVINRLADARLLTTSTESVEVAHEALIREWPRLRGWLDDDREGLRLHRHVTESAQAWERLGRDAGELYRGARLTAAMEWMERSQPVLNAQERAFLEASRAEHEREVHEAQARVRRLRILASVASGLFVVAAVVGALALVQWRNANEQRDKAKHAAQEATLARLETDIPVLLAEQDRSLSFALAAQAYKLAPGPRTASLLNVVLGADVRYIGRLWPTEPGLVGVAVSPDGGYVVTRTNGGLIELWDAATWKLVASTRTAPGDNFTNAFLADGKSFASLSRTGAYELEVFEVPSLRRLWGWSWNEPFGTSGYQPITADGSHFGITSGGALRIFNLRDGSDEIVTIPGMALADTSVPYVGSVSFAASLAFDPTGRFLAAQVAAPAPPGTIAVFDTRSLQLVSTFRSAGGVMAMQFSPDGTTVATLGVDFVSPYMGTVEVWDTTTGERLAGKRSEGVLLGGLDFSESGLLLAAVSGTPGGALVREAAGLAEVEPPYSFRDGYGVWPAFGPGDRSLYTFGYTTAGVLEEWDLTGSGPIASYVKAERGRAITVAPDGKWFVLQENNGRWSRWSLPGLTLLNRSEVAPGPAAFDHFDALASPVKVSGDERLIATAHTDCLSGQTGCDGSVIVWDAASGRPIGSPLRVPGAPDLPFAVHMAFDPTSKRLAVAGPAAFETWSVDGGLSRQSELPGGDYVGLEFAARPGGPLLVAFRYDGNVEFFDDSSGTTQPVGQTAFPGTLVQSSGMSAGGKVVLVLESGINFYEPEELARADNPKPVLTLPGAGGVGAKAARLSFSADGRYMAISPWQPRGGRVMVWDLAQGQLIGGSFSQLSTLRRDAEFTPDGRLLVLDGDTVKLWSLDVNRWAEKVCFAAGRNLTEAEWAKYLPGRDYEVTCPQWPAKPKI